MKKQKVLATLLAAVMTMSMAACGSESNSQESSTASVTDSQSTVSSSSESEPEDNFTYPMEAVTLTINNDNDFYDMTDYGYVPAEDFFWNVLKEKTGVTLVNDGPTPEAYNFDEEYMLMLISGELPDMLYGNWTSYSGGPAQAIADDYIIALNDYEQYMPNLMKYLEENPNIAADVEAQIRANFDKLMGNQSRIAAAKAAGKAVNVSADDFDDED